MAGTLQDVSDANFQAEVIESETPVLVDFWAPWCGPCRVVAPVLEEIAGERPDLRIVKLNVDDNQQTAAQFDVLSIPTMIVFKNGQLKVYEDREHVLQGADYWRRVEAHRRRGHIERAKLFGDLQIKDEAPLVYLVAPTLRVHPSFATLARCIAGDIEIYRFDINEDWRSGVRVMRRMRVN